MVLGAGAAAVACCALLPLALGAAGGLALGTVLGSGALVFVVVAIVLITVVVRRTRASCPPED